MGVTAIDMVLQVKTVPGESRNVHTTAGLGRGVRTASDTKNSFITDHDINLEGRSRGQDPDPREHEVIQAPSMTRELVPDMILTAPTVHVEQRSERNRVQACRTP